MIFSLRRTFLVAATLMQALFVFFLRSAIARLGGRHLGGTYWGEQLARVFELLGGGYLKVGQILSTRTDILSEDFALPLQRLQDSLSAFPPEDARAIVERSLHTSTEQLFLQFDPHPIGSATIAQVHRAILRHSGTPVAVKIRRPDIDRMIRTDSRTFMVLCRLASVLPRFRGIPIVEATQQITRAVEAQANFRAEADHHRQIFALFESGVPVRVPRLFDEYCTDEILVMEYFPQVVRITAPELDARVHRNAVIAGLQALYRMVFVAGLVHCDLHPGNILVGPNGAVLILDFGFMTVMPLTERLAFAEFFLCIAFNDGTTAARIVLETALRVPDDLDRGAFQREVDELVGAFSGRMAGEFLVADFVNSLFNVQRRHKIYGSPSFTMAILSLIVYEGIIRYRCADLDFQREAIPTLLISLRQTEQADRAKGESCCDFTP